MVSILDYSKLLMYHYHYGVFKKLYKDKIRLPMTDTDSLFYEIKSDDGFKDLYDKDSKFRYMFDNSNFNKTNPCFFNF